MLKIGAAKTDITPPIGLSLSGFAVRRDRPSTAFDDPLYVKALACETESIRVLLLSYDLLGLDRALDKLIRDRLDEALAGRVARSQVILTTTHTHSAPPTMPIAGETRVPGSYIEKICQATISASSEALVKLTSAVLYHGSALIQNANHNRRRGYAPGLPDAAFPLDQELDLFQFRASDGTCLGSIVRFSCHAVTMTTQHVSADFPGELTNRLEKRSGAPCLFLEGTAGDSNPLIHSQDHAAMLAFTGTIMAQIADLPDRLERVPDATLRFASTSFSLALAEFPPKAEVEKRINLNERILSGDQESPDLQPLVKEYAAWRYPFDTDLSAVVAHWAKVYQDSSRLTLRAIEHPDMFAEGVPFRAIVLCLGNFCFVFLTGEILTPVGQHIQALAQGREVRVISYLSPIVGYIADPASYPVGGYELDNAWLWYGMPGPFHVNIESTILKQVESLFADIFPEV